MLVYMISALYPQPFARLPPRFLPPVPLSSSLTNGIASRATFFLVQRNTAECAQCLWKNSSHSQPECL